MDILNDLLVGPELLWLLLALCIRFVIKWSGAPSEKLDAWWIRLTYLLPPLGVSLTFGLYYCPLVDQRWLLFRIWASCLVGGNYVLSRALRAHSEQGPGVGTAYIMGMSLMFVALVIGSLILMIRQF
ncbi:MAG: hypothetical protein JNL02_12450 [Saprospiraceae bacterium]|nr:hypothetical protein [Saprospiraceae bacterium]